MSGDAEEKYRELTPTEEGAHDVSRGVDVDGDALKLVWIGSDVVADRLRRFIPSNNGDNIPHVLSGPLWPIRRSASREPLAADAMVMIFGFGLR